jgi:hypothetical protein
MNNTFNINRFGKVLAFDGRKYIRNFGLTLAILCGLNLVLWILTLVFNFTMPTLPRWGVIYFAMFLAIIMVPAKAFGDINLSREGVRFAMLPASNLEKYLSYILFCLLTPVVVVFASWGVDSLLTLLPFGGFEHYIRHFGIMGMMQDFLMEIGELTQDDMSGEGFETYQKTMSIVGPAYNYRAVIGWLFSIGLFMLGNLLFKSHKTVKTLLIMIGVSYAITMVMQIIFVSKGIFPWMNNKSMGISADPVQIVDYARGAMLVSNIINTILVLGLYIGIFFKLKTQKY